MAVRTTGLGGTDFTFGESPVPSADFNDTNIKILQYGGVVAGIGLNAQLNVLRLDEKAGDDFTTTNMFYDIFTDATKIDVLTDVALYTSTTDRYYALDIQTTTPDEDCDFTGATLDADWSLTTTGDSTNRASTFDAANDEVDLDSGNGDGSVRSGTAEMSYYTDKDIVITEVQLRNLAITQNSSAEKRIRLYVGDQWIGIRMTTAATNTIINDEGDTIAGGAGTEIAFKIEKRGGKIKTYYDNDGGTTWVQLGSEYDGTVGVGTIKMTAEVGSTNQGTDRAKCSVFDFKIYDTFESSGTLTTTTETVTANDNLELDFADVVNTTNTSLTQEISHDNGSNYLVLINGYGWITDTGTTLKKRYTFATTDTSETPQLYGHINKWTNFS